MTDERWQPIPDFPGYEVSDQGRVRSHRQGRARLLVSHRDDGGYVRVNAYHADGRRRRPFVHRLVASAFHGPCPEGLECRHLNGNQLDNSPRNLRWGTKAENALDKIEHGTHPYDRLTHCSKGHPFDDANTLWRGTRGGRMSGRICRICHAENHRQWKARRAQRSAVAA